MTINTTPDRIYAGDHILFGNATWMVKSLEPDYNGAYDFYLENETGAAHAVITDSVTLIV